MTVFDIKLGPVGRVVRVMRVVFQATWLLGFKSFRLNTSRSQEQLADGIGRAAGQEGQGHKQKRTCCGWLCCSDQIYVHSLQDWMPVSIQEHSDRPVHLMFCI